MQAGKTKTFMWKDQGTLFFMDWQQTFFIFRQNAALFVYSMLVWWKGSSVLPNNSESFYSPKTTEKWGVLYVGRAMMCLWIEIKGN